MPVGRPHGRGWVLLKKSDLDGLSLTTDHDLVFSGADTAHVRTLTSITLLKAECVTPGSATDPNSVYLCEVVDRRWHLARIPVNKAYNVYSADGTGHLTDTKNAGSAWTWQEIVTNLSNTILGIGTLTLPFTPDATPNDFSYFGGYAWGALCDVLDRIACAVEYDAEANTFSVVRLGSTDTTASAEVTALDGQRLWDGYNSEAVRGWRPEKVRVLFRRKPEPKTGASPYFAEDVTLTATSGVFTGSYVTLRDDLPALGSSGAPSNAAAITTRAAERAADWLRKRGGYERPVLRVYKDYHDANTLLGSLHGTVAYDDRGAFATLLSAQPDGRLEAWRPFSGTASLPPATPQSNPAPVPQEDSALSTATPSVAPDDSAPFPPAMQVSPETLYPPLGSMAVAPPASPLLNSAPSLTTEGNLQNTPLLITTATVNGDPSATATLYAGTSLTGASDATWSMTVSEDGAGGTGPTITSAQLTDTDDGYGVLRSASSDTSNRTTQVKDSFVIYDGSAKLTSNVTYTASGGVMTVAYPSGTVITGATVSGAARTQGTATASGSSSADPTQLANDAVDVSGADGTKGVRLPDTTGGLIAVRNVDAAILKVYPTSGGQIDNAGADVAFNLNNGSYALFARTSANRWFRV